MKKIKRFNLSTQINLIFTSITVLTSILFLLIFNQAIREIVNKQSTKDHLTYHELVVTSQTNGLPIVVNKHYAYIIFRVNDPVRFQYDILAYELSGVIEYSQIEEFARKSVVLGTVKSSFTDGTARLNVIGNRVSGTTNIIAMTISGGSYGKSLGAPISNIISIGFIAIIILGNAIILLWSSVTVEKIKRLESEVSKLSSDGYQTPIVVEGSDELTDLAKTIENMRLEILENDSVKQEMLQNVSHDIKTPIAVIQSYAEAIIDGISEPGEAVIILKQTEILNRKTKQLLEWNKLEYLKDPKDFELIGIKEILINVVNNHKYVTNINFELDLDDTKYLGISENFYTVFSNIIDNALRYAETTIKIVLKDKKLTFFNDGESISDSFIDHVFKPYEKGHKGQFGLGMTIVQKTLTSFHLNLIVANVENGVTFTIEPC